MTHEPEDTEIIEDSTTAENIRAWKELLSSSEAREFVKSVLEKSTGLFGQTPSVKIVQTISNLVLMLAAFGCVGAMAYLKLVPDGTSGALAGIIIGYFFRKNG
jgi:hypothetical protein